MTGYLNKCVNCPDGCRNCGADRTPVTMCDECGEPIRGDIYRKGANELCEGCAVEIANTKFDEMTLDEAMQFLGFDEDEFDSTEALTLAIEEYWDEMSAMDKCEIAGIEVKAK